MRTALLYLLAVLAATIVLNDASGMVVLGGAFAGVGLLFLRRRRLRPLAFALVLGGPLVSFSTEALWSRAEASFGASPDEVADWITAGAPWTQLRANARIRAFSVGERTEVVAALAARSGATKRNLRAYELDAVPLAIARGVASAQVATLCERHAPEVREANTAGGGRRPGHLACAAYVK